MNYKLYPLLTNNNLLTIGMLREIHKHHLSIPEEIAIVAYGEMDWMFVMNPPLTVVAQPTYEVGQTAIHLLLERIQKMDRPISKVILQPSVYIQQSSMR